MNLFLSALILSTSFSLRTPKVGNDTDWQYLLNAEKPKQYSINFEEEKDSGIRYTNQEYWIRKDFKDPFWGSSFFTRDRYVSRDDRKIYYNQAEFNFTNDGWYMGYALRHVNSIPSHRMVGGYEMDKMITGISRLVFRFGINSNLDVVDYNIHAKFSVSLTKMFEVFALTVFEEADKRRYRQFKVGVSLELPS